MLLQRTLCVAGLVCLAACADDELPPAGPADASRTTTSSTGAESPRVTLPPVPDALLEHMHRHAAQLARLDAELLAGNLEAAGTPAYWLARHETQPGLPDEWRPYVERMRAEAGAVETATDLATARAAADRIRAACRECHDAGGFDVDI